MAKGRIRGNKEAKKPKSRSKSLFRLVRSSPIQSCQAYKTPILIVAGTCENATSTVAFSHSERPVGVGLIRTGFPGAVKWRQ